MCVEHKVKKVCRYWDYRNMIGDEKNDGQSCYVKIPSNKQLIRRLFLTPNKITDKIEGMYDSYAEIETRDDWLQVRYIP